MNKTLYYVCKDLRTNIPMIVFFIGQLLIVNFYFYFCIAEIISNYDYGNQIKKLRDHNIVEFDVFYGAQPVSITPDIDILLTDVLDHNGKGYSVLDHIHFDEYEQVQTVIGLGAFGRIFGLTPEKNTIDDPILLIGSNVKNLNVGDKIPVGIVTQEDLVITSRLPEGSSYLKGQRSINLDNSIVLLINYENFKFYYDYYYIEPIISNIGLANPSNEELYNFISIISKSEYFTLSPKIFNEYSAEVFNINKSNNFFFFVFFLVTILFIFLGIISNISIMIDQKLKEYAINRLYGASLFHLYCRTVLYLIFIVAPPFILSYLIINMIEDLIPLSLFLFILLISVLLLSILPIRQIKKNDMLHFLRRDI